ncbi:hypothetical protein CR203_07330 [Salipaludibacillus neizhouensis]|uniref:VanZ-like domain-containing protein n=1 Tax=Salipaludibacillus neizhouensis TaxID=885475 RepID=A0A3A9KKG0_9BACI|nr:VanZ family protein [Salipaludibacillus neizhouensis]RKL68285.1 hypothetical protein CR203_07330 [Salipaludibacillus neizhouensis]
MFNIFAVLVIVLTIFIASSMGSEQQDISPILEEISDRNSLTNTLSSLKNIVQGIIEHGVTFITGNPLLGFLVFSCLGLCVFLVFYRLAPKKEQGSKKTIKSFLLTMFLFFFLLFFLIAVRSETSSELIRAFVSFDKLRTLLLYIEFSYAGITISVHTLGVENFLQFVIRKCAHFFLFSLLGFFLYLIIYKYCRQRILSIVLTVLFVTGYAALDEFRQSLLPTRTPLKEDVMLDTAGGIFGVSMAILKSTISEWFSKRRKL